MKKIICITVAAIAAFFMFPLLSAVAYADGGEIPEPEEIVVVEEITLGEAPPNETAPFTPAGTGTVVDNATDADGKEFFTIMTPAENIFYLVIDRQRGQENVYFLNAVTEADLLALAEMPLTSEPAPIIPEQPSAPVEPEPAPTPEASSNIGMYIIIVVIVILGGGAVWYIKIYRPKQQGDVDGEEYETAGNDYSDDWGNGQDEISDASSWDESGTDE